MAGMDLGLAGQVYLVTGGTSGLGLATAQALVADGARVVVSSRRPEAVADAVSLLGSDSAAGVVADNADPETPGVLIRTAHETFGRLDGGLISVGGPPSGTAMDASDEQWHHAFDTVFLGAVRLCRTLAADLQDGGSIALVLSSSVRSPISHLAISNGLRPGLAMYAKTLADEVGPAACGSSACCPGASTPRASASWARLAPTASRSGGLVRRRSSAG